MILKRKKLGEIIKLEYGKPLPESERKLEGAYPVYGANGIKSRSDLSYVNYRSIIIGRKGSAGDLNLTEEKFWPLDVTYFVTYDEQKYDLGFLYRLLASINLPKLAKGVKPGLNRNDVYSISVKIPELIDEQRKIAQAIDAADILRQKRRQAIELLDSYLKSVFLDMFGDSINDSTIYQPIGEITTFIDYRGKTPEKANSGIPLITAKHVKKGFFSFDPEEYISEEKYNDVMTRGFPRPNDVLFTTEGATLGNVCRIPRHMDRFGVGQRLITLQCKDCLTSEYLHFILLNDKIRLEIFKQATGSAAQGIRSAKFSRIKIPVPRKELQTRFSMLVMNSESLKQKMLAQSKELENQFQAMMQQAFNHV